MQPKIENVSVAIRVDVAEGKIEATVTNSNLMPISKCTVGCKFTIMFLESGYSPDIEYGRGSKTIIVEDIDGNSEKTETVSFDPDDYYDGYLSYRLASLVDTSANVISIN